MATVLKAKFEWNNNSVDLLHAKNLEKGGRVQQAIDNAVISYNMQFCPWETGTLAKSPYSASPPGGGKVVYNTPYARYLYYGLVMGPNIPIFEDDSGEPTRWYSPPGQKKKLKTPEQQIVFKTDTNPLAGAFWFERMKAVHGDDILQEAIRVANGE